MNNNKKRGGMGLKQFKIRMTSFIDDPLRI